MLKKLGAVLFFVVLLGFSSQETFAEEQNKVNIYFFWGEGCPHCAHEKPFLEELKNKYPGIIVHDFEVWENSQNRKLFIEVGKKLNEDISGVPFAIIGDKTFIGYAEGINSQDIEARVKYCSAADCPDSVAPLLAANSSTSEKENEEKSPPAENQETKENPIPEKITLPFLGEIKTKNLSLPVFTVVLGVLDGFNPCAMWTLLFLISLLLGMENRKRMWILGTAFIIASASVYFLFMAAWLNLILFIGFLVWVRIAIGLVALFGGGYNLKEFFTNPQPGCKVTGGEKRQKVFEKIRNITHEKSFYLALGGIIILAFAVNLVELICSAGLPAIYTQVLALSHLAKWQYYLYILLYIFFFMLDDLFVFLAAMITLQATGITTKYTRWSHLIGGILVMIIGILLIFKPAWLML